VKYEFWFYYLKKIKYRNIPLLLVSALFRSDMSFFKWYGGLQRKMLSRFDHLFVQNAESKKLIDEIGLGEICSISGDTRFDRVIEIANRFEPITVIEEFIGKNKALVAGSTWKEDEDILQKTSGIIDDQTLHLIIAPHETNEKHIQEIVQLFPGAILFSGLSTGKVAPLSSRVLIIDNIGMLSRLYKYAYITYVGGGHTSNGVHNVLEAAVYGKPVFFGPYYEKYQEAIGLVKSGGAMPIKDEKELKFYIDTTLESAELHARASARSKQFVLQNKGATDKIIQFIQEKRLLTS
jgi:3-deoxy-D-manno-octulosonic-acid transferase